MFTCSKCGNCCRHVGDFPFMKDYNRGDGTCVHLTDENLCDIYENRPPVCNTELLYEKFYSRYMTRDEYDAMNMEACKNINAKTRENNATETHTI